MASCSDALWVDMDAAFHPERVTHRMSMRRGKSLGLVAKDFLHYYAVLVLVLVRLVRVLQETPRDGLDVLDLGDLAAAVGAGTGYWSEESTLSLIAIFVTLVKMLWSTHQGASSTKKVRWWFFVTTGSNDYKLQWRCGAPWGVEPQ